RDVAIELGIAREVDDAGRAAAELAHEAIARTGLHARDIARGDRLAGDGRRTARDLAQPLDAHAHVRIVDVAAEHRLVVAQRALVIAALAGVLGEQVVRAQGERLLVHELLEVRDRGVELAALLVALDEVRAQRRALVLRHFGNAQQLLGPLDREALVTAAPHTVDAA